MAREPTATPDAPGGGTAPRGPGIFAGAGWLAWLALAVIFVLVGQRFPTWATGTLWLVLLYLGLSHADEVAALGEQLASALAQPFS